MGPLFPFRRSKIQSEEDVSRTRRGHNLLPGLSIGQWWSRSSTEWERVSKLHPERSLTSIMDEIRTEEELIRFRQQKPLFRIDPEGIFKTRWDMFMLILVYYVSLATPLSLAFFADDQRNTSNNELNQVELSRQCQEDDLHTTVSNAKYFIFLQCPPFAYTVVDIAVDVLFWIDLAMAFITGYKPDHSLTTEYNFAKIRRKYLSSWFTIDVLAVLPVDRIVNSLFSGHSVQLEIAKLTRLLRLSRLLKRMGEIMASKSFRIIYLLILYTTIAHWIGCAFFFSGRWQVENLKAAGANQFTGEPWLIHQCLQFANFRTQYCMSLYWAFTTMTTVGYGDILPTTNIDRNITCLVMVVSAVVQAIIFGNVAVLMQAMDDTRKRLQTKLDAVWELLTFHNLPEEVKFKAVDVIEYSWNFSQGVEDAAILESFPEGLRTDLLLHTRPQIIPVFEDISKGFQRAIISRFQLRICVPGDYAGDTGSEMYIIRDGVCVVFTEDESTTLAVLTSGDYFGDIDMILRSRRMATVKAQSYCTLYVLEREALEQVLEGFPDVRNTILEKTKRRKTLLTSQNSSITEKKVQALLPSTRTDDSDFTLSSEQSAGVAKSNKSMEKQIKPNNVTQAEEVVMLSKSIISKMINSTDLDNKEEDVPSFRFSFPVFSPATTDE